MSCYFPLHGFRARTRNPSGKRSIVFSKSEGFVDQPVVVPCGQCIGCRLERSRQWAIRLTHEKKSHAHSCFVTLTYRDENLPEHGSIQVRDFQLFMKRLRKEVPQARIKYFHCGEYGENFQRPHYHALIFNCDFADRKYWRSENDQHYFTSNTLEDIWSHGFTVVGDVTFESAAYVARYVTKKLTGDCALEYLVIDKETGEILVERRPEYSTGSNGLGKAWFERFRDDYYPSDEVVLRGVRMRPPKYYDSLLEKTEQALLEKIKGDRKRNAKKFAHNNTGERLIVREVVKRAQFGLLKRGFEC